MIAMSTTAHHCKILQRLMIPKGPCAQIVHTLAPNYLPIGTTVRPKYILFRYMDPEGLVSVFSFTGCRWSTVLAWDLGSWV